MPPSVRDAREAGDEPRHLTNNPESQSQTPAPEMKPQLLSGQQQRGQPDNLQFRRPGNGWCLSLKFRNFRN